MYSFRVYRTPEPPSIARESQPPSTPVENPMSWGAPVWYLLHTLAEKTRAERFPAIKTQLVSLIETICRALPCPKCAAHAASYILAKGLANVRSREELKDWLLRFHNDVSAKKGQPTFTREQLDDMYSKAIFISIINNFIQAFRSRAIGTRNMASDMHRQRVGIFVKSWIYEHRDAFQEL